MKSKKISLLLIAFMMALLWEATTKTIPYSAKTPVMTDPSTTSAFTDGYDATASADDVSGFASGSFHQSIATRIQAACHEYLASPVYMTDERTRLLSAPLPSASMAILLSDSHSLFPRSFCLDVKYLPQNPELPTGCEAVALTTVLNYLGYPVTKFEIVDDFLPKGEPGKVDPDYAFPGSPYSQGGFGCYSPAIVKTANDYFAAYEYTDDIAVDVSGLTVPELCIDYLYKYNRPVVFWASINMVHIGTNFEWTIDRKKVPCRFNTHCLALIGWTENTYVFSDPLCGIVEYEKNLVEEVYKENMENAVFIMPSRFYLRTYVCPQPTSYPG